MFNVKSFCLAVVFCFSVSHILASRPDSHAPIGVMGDHTHQKGEWMLSYRTMTMAMNGNRSGTRRVSDQGVLSQYMVAPKRMDMEMHMAGLMFAPTNRLTLMAMVPYLRLSMDHVNRLGRTFTTEMDGLGDIGATALVVLWQTANQQIHFNAGLTVPTGSIDERGDTLMPDQPLPYPMQLGSGTYDVLPGLTYTGRRDRLSWGVQGVYIWRLEENDRDYTLGDSVKANVWGAVNLASWASSAVRFEGQSWGDIEGADTRLNPAMVATADPERKAGDRIDIFWGVNLIKSAGVLDGHRLAFEIGAPVYERLDGPQLETDILFQIGWQKAF